MKMLHGGYYYHFQGVRDFGIRLKNAGQFVLICIFGIYIDIDIS